MVALTNLLDPDFRAVEAGSGGVGCFKGAEGYVANGHLRPVGLAPGSRVGKTIN